MSKRLTEHSQLYSEWHFERNTTIDIEKIVIGSGKKVWWKCNNGHEWQNVINKRAIGKQGCPFCSGRKPSLENNLSITNPELINEWNFKENIIQPQMITYGSEKRVNWICKEGHKWLARVNQRTKGIGCPFCSRLKASEDNNLIITHHEVASEWHWEKNHPLIPTEFLFGSDKIVWWICKIGHEWQLKINKRTIRNQNCPICNKRKVTTEYNLQIEYPEIAKQWHYEKNGDKQPNQFLPNSNIRVWWKCEKNIDHEWDCTINNRVFGSRCPICSGRKVVKSNSLQIVNPILSAQWHPTKNSDLLPKDFVSNSNKKVWWKCNMSEDHEWEATIVNRNKGRGCPMCRGLSVVLSNCLETTHPNIAFQWNFDRNLDLKPQSVVAGSHSKVWWVCNKDKTHEWEAIIKNRTLKNHGCPFCRLTSQSRQELIILFELKYIFDSISPKGFKFKEGKRRFNIDIFIQELNLGIEYDGSYWHRDKYLDDKEKIEICKSRNLILWRIREEPLQKISEDDIVSTLPFFPKNIVDKVLKNIIEKFSDKLQKQCLMKIHGYLASYNIKNTKEFEMFTNNILTERSK